MEDLTPLGVLVKYGKDLGLEGAKLQEFVEEHKAKELKMREKEEQSAIAQRREEREHELKMREKEEQSAFTQRREQQQYDLMMKEKEADIRMK
ncbi:hypothetical protein SNEBB_010478 [Seison nebaliae]|nr:hypothetical protein SNEBB_010478 [Seison nebaliae]